MGEYFHSKPKVFLDRKCKKVDDIVIPIVRYFYTATFCPRFSVGTNTHDKFIGYLIRPKNNLVWDCHLSLRLFNMFLVSKKFSL